MKYAITKEQRFFFDTHHFIEFEELLSERDRELILKGVEKTLQSSVDKLSQNDILLRGRDLTRAQPDLRKILFVPRLGYMALELSMAKKLRFGFDQLYCGPKGIAPNVKIFSRLEDASCIRGLSCALMICLKGEVEESLPVSDAGIDPFPRKPGSGIFFLPSALCNPQALEAHSGQLFLLLTWAKEKAQYVFAPDDPHTHDLKKLDHVFGDSLTEKYHPMLCKR